MVDSDAVVEFAPDTLHDWWLSDSEHTNYSVFAPQWLEMVKQNVLVNGLSKDPTPEPGYQLAYLHSTKSTLTRMTPSQDF
eukprot:1031073-Amphidinium_carterae.1